jgi:hypothetical protein
LGKHDRNLHANKQRVAIWNDVKVRNNLSQNSGKKKEKKRGFIGFSQAAAMREGVEPRVEIENSILPHGILFSSTIGSNPQTMSLQLTDYVEDTIQSFVFELNR